MNSVQLTVRFHSDPSDSSAFLHPTTLKSLPRSPSSPDSLLLLENQTLVTPFSTESTPVGEVWVPNSFFSPSLAQGQTVEVRFIDPGVISPATKVCFKVNSFTGAKDVWTQQELTDLYVRFRSDPYISGNHPITLRFGGECTMTLSLKIISTISNPDWDHYGLFTPQTQLTFENASLRPLRIIPAQEMAILNGELSFAQLGIGGMQSQEATFRRRVIGSRMVPIEVLNELGVKHVRGILLHGPPGTGKTLIARQLAAALNSREPKIVNGPEILSKFVGEGEKKLRELFSEAEEEQKLHGDYSKLHVLIFDEIDALCKTRGSTGSSAVDNIVNQFLSKLDGVNSLNNLLVIGMTNRIDLIDPAVLRPGRLELHIEVGLPDEAGRTEIVKIHTAAMRMFGWLGPDVDIPEVAHRAQNFTGAECEALVKAAIAYFIVRGGKQVSSIDFENAAKDVLPAHGQDRVLSTCDRLITAECREIEGKLRTVVGKFGENSPLRQLNVLIAGAAGTGKTSLALFLAKSVGFPCVKVINSERLLGLTEAGKVDLIVQTFEEARKSTRSVIVLDEIESLLGYVSYGNRFSIPVLQSLKVKLSDCTATTRKTVVLATSNSPQLLQQLSLFNKFDVVEELHLLSTRENREEISEILQQCGAPTSKFDGVLRQFPEVSIRELMLQCTA